MRRFLVSGRVWKAIERGRGNDAQYISLLGATDLTFRIVHSGMDAAWGILSERRILSRISFSRSSSGAFEKQ